MLLHALGEPGPWKWDIYLNKFIFNLLETYFGQLSRKAIGIGGSLTKDGVT